MAMLKNLRLERRLRQIFLNRSLIDPSDDLRECFWSYRDRQLDIATKGTPGGLSS